MASHHHHSPRSSPLPQLTAILTSATQRAGAVNEIQDLYIPGCTGSNVSGNLRARSHLDLGITPFSLQTLAKSTSLTQSLPTPSYRLITPILPPVPRWMHLVFTHIVVIPCDWSSLAGLLSTAHHGPSTRATAMGRWRMEPPHLVRETALLHSGPHCFFF